MKTAFLSLLAILAIDTNAQNYLSPSGYGAWAELEVATTEREKFDLFKQFDEQFEGTSTEMIGYHIIDINIDGLLDLVYSGPLGEDFGAIIYLNNGSEFERSDVIAGEVVRVERTRLLNCLEIKTHMRPCCLGQVHTLSSYLAYAYLGIKVIDVSNISYMEGTAEPMRFIDEIRFITTNAEYKLRATPEILTEFNAWPETFDGNTCAIYPSGSRGSAIAESTDDTGRVWWFVIMENNLDPIKSLLPYHSRSGGYKSMGWMSSRFVKKLN